MRKPIVAGNWKMNKTLSESAELANMIKRDAYDVGNVDIVLAPPFTALADVSEILTGSDLMSAAQNCHWEREGAFTGEVSVAMIKSAGAEHVILGHSERRKYFGETDKVVNDKARIVLEAGLGPIICVGETLSEREEGKTLEIVREQIKGVLDGLDERSASRAVIAYEPVWAIGTGRTATPEQAQEVHAVIRSLLSELYSSSFAGALRILYGGSMNPDNCEELMKEEDIDGGLIGGASLKPESFVDIINKTSAVYS